MLADINLTLTEELVNGICLCILFRCELLPTKPVGFLSLLAWQIFHCNKVNTLEDAVFKFSLTPKLCTVERKSPPTISFFSKECSVCHRCCTGISSLQYNERLKKLCVSKNVPYLLSFSCF